MMRCARIPWWRSAVAAAALLVALGPGCALGPNYERPAAPVPDHVRGDLEPDPTSLGDLPWWAVFGDPTLQALIREAVAANLDLRAATARVEQARHLIGVARSDLYPQLGYGADASRQRAALGPSDAVTFNNFLATFELAWEIDLWGRIRRLSEAARADYLAAEEARHGVLLTLIGDVATAYFDLLGLDREVEITLETIDAFHDTLDLFQRCYEAGITTRLEVSRAAAALSEAQAVLPDLERLITARENQLCVLLGRPPCDIERPTPLEEQYLLPEVPVGLPSQLLERRPDIRQAEQAMVAANAEVGVAVATFFPRLGLTSLYGAQSSELENLVKGSGAAWSVGASLSGPLFQGGRLLSNYRASEAQLDEAVLRWEQVVLQAFAEVSSSLVNHQKIKLVRQQRAETVKHLEISVTLSLKRYLDGIASYFEVLEAQQQFFPAELLLARAERNELIAVVDMYRALGGGWQLEEDAVADTESGEIE